MSDDEPRDINWDRLSPEERRAFCRKNFPYLSLAQHPYRVPIISTDAKWHRLSPQTQWMLKQKGICNKGIWELGVYGEQPNAKATAS